MNIEELKNQLIATDDEILKLFIRHLELTQLIGKEKAKEGKGLYDRKAEENCWNVWWQTARRKSRTFPSSFSVQL